MNKEYQEALNYINKSVCTLLALRGIQDDKVIHNLHILQEAIEKATKYDELLSVLEEYNVDLSNIREILVAGNMAQNWKDKANKYDEKETPKKPIRKRIYYNCRNGECDKTFFYYCPVCNYFSVEKCNFCPNCSQKIDWSDK